MVCERWCVTKMVCKRGYVKDGVWQSCVSKMVCDKVVCERWCVKDGGWQSGVWTMVRERWWATKLGVKDGVWRHAKRSWMWHCATPTAQSAAASRATKTSPSAPPSAISAMPATQNEGGCEIVPHLPRKVPRRHGRLKPAQARHPVP